VKDEAISINVRNFFKHLGLNQQETVNVL